MKFVLAPLAEFTDAPFRRLCGEFGAETTYTEMVSAAALFHGHAPTRHLMETMPGEVPVVCQLFGSNEDEIAFAAREASALGTGDCPRFCELNLNAGCPMPRIMKSGSGAKLVTNPDLVYRLLKAIVDNTTLPVTLKTRLGPKIGENTIFELADAAERAGAKGLVVHARYTSQMHGGPVHLETLAEVVQKTRLPVTGNGGIKTEADAEAMSKTGVTAIMVARTALRDPAIFARLRGTVPTFSGTVPSFSRGTVPSLTPVETARRHLRYLIEFRKNLAEKFPNDHILGKDAFIALKARTHLFRYFAGIPGAAALRKRFNAVQTLADVNSLLDGDAC